SSFKITKYQFQSFLGLYFLKQQISALQHIINLPSFGSWSGYSILIKFEINFILFVATSKLAVGFFYIGAVMAVILMLILIIRLKQAKVFVKPSECRKFSPHQIDQFLRYTVEFIRYLKDANRIYGKLYFVVLLFNGPSNATVVILLLFQLGKFQLIQQIILFIIIYTQIFFIFIIQV